MNCSEEWIVVEQINKQMKWFIALLHSSSICRQHKLVDVMKCSKIKGRVPRIFLVPLSLDST